MPSREIASTEVLLTYTSLFIILIWAVLLRIDTYSLWQITPEKFLLHNGEPMLSTLDGYYYLNTAKEILAGKYTSTDTMRAYPDTVSRSIVPPLLSCLISTLHKISGLSLNWLGAILPVSLGVLVAFPIFWISKRWGGYTMAIGAVALGTLSFHYAQRTSLARLDTDCLNVTLALTCTYLFYLFGKTQNLRRYFYLFAGLIIYMIYLWWWDMSPGAATILALSPLLVAIILDYRPPLRQALIFYTSIICVALALFAIRPTILADAYNIVFDQFNYVSKQNTGIFPNIGISIAEQRSIPLYDIYNLTVKSWFILGISVTGICLITYYRKFDILYLLPISIVGIFSIFFANRFAIFLTPIIAIGFGYFFFILYSKLKNKIYGLLLLALAILFIGWKSQNLGAGHESAFISHIYRGMENIKTLTEENAVIWSWWDEGHPLIYFGERPTISDGYIHGGELTYLTALPFATSNERLAANFIMFYATQGANGLHRFLQATGLSRAESYVLLQDILSQPPSEASTIIASANLKSTSQTGPDSNNDWLKFFFPDKETSAPVYVFIDSHLVSRQRWIHWYGTWDIDTRQGIKTLRTIQIDQVSFNAFKVPSSPSFTLDLNTGHFFIPNIFANHLQLQEITTTEGSKSTSRTYPITDYDTLLKPPLVDKIQKSNTIDEKHTNTGEYVLELFPAKNMILLQDRIMNGNIINRLYWREIESKHFTLIDKASDYQIWKVQSDRLE